MCMMGGVQTNVDAQHQPPKGSLFRWGWDQLYGRNTPQTPNKPSTAARASTALGGAGGSAGTEYAREKLGGSKPTILGM